MVNAKIINRHKVCWSCGGGMAPYDYYYKCQKCGATYIDLHEIKPPGMGVILFENKPKQVQ